MTRYVTAYVAASVVATAAAADWISDKVAVVVAIATGLAAVIYIGKMLRRGIAAVIEVSHRIDQIHENTSRLSGLEARIGSLENRFDNHFGRIVPTQEEEPPHG